MRCGNLFVHSLLGNAHMLAYCLKADSVCIYLCVCVFANVFFTIVSLGLNPRARTMSHSGLPDTEWKNIGSNVSSGNTLPDTLGNHVLSTIRAPFGPIPLKSSQGTVLTNPVLWIRKQQGRLVRIFTQVYEAGWQFWPVLTEAAFLPLPLSHLPDAKAVVFVSLGTQPLFYPWSRRCF